MNKDRIFTFLVSFLIVACSFDIYTAISHNNFSSLETNPIVQFMGFGDFITFKIALNLIVGFVFFVAIYKSKHRFNSFAMTYLIIMLAVMQIFGGYSNIEAKNKILEDMQDKYGADKYPTIDSIPVETVEKEYAMEQTEAIKGYFNIMFIAMILPIIITFGSFKVWEWIYFEN